MTDFIHLTNASNVDAIMTEGLRAGQMPELTADASWALNWYEANPIFLALPDSEFVIAMTGGPWAGHAVISVNAKGLALVADLASLIDHGGSYDPDGYISWRPGRAPEQIAPFLDDHGSIELSSLLDPDTDVCKAAIKATGTAACSVNIEPTRLSLASLATRMRP